ncbi:MAG: hypothetical protein NVSMB52_11460 [Chloroflexota bacterium]
MGIVLAIVFLLVAVAASVAYNGTPHGGPTTVCGPVNFFNHTTIIHADCRYVSVTEIVIAVVFFILALSAAISARPRGEG